MCWVFVAVRGLSLVAVSKATVRCGAWTSYWGGFSCCGARAPGVQASVVVVRGLSSRGSRALKRRLSSCGARALLLCGMWDLPGPGLKPVSPALAGGFLTTALPGKPNFYIFISIIPDISQCSVRQSSVLTTVFDKDPHTNNFQNAL